MKLQYQTPVVILNFVNDEDVLTLSTGGTLGNDINVNRIDFEGSY